MSTDLFGNVVWPSSCIYNVQGDAGSKCDGGADIEHHFDADGKPNVWVQKRKEKTDQAYSEYAEYVRTRCSSSD